MEQYDISDEVERTYLYPAEPGQGGFYLTIDYPRTLYVKRDERGESHRILTMDNEVYYPRRGWLGIVWEPRDPDNPVQF